MEPTKLTPAIAVDFDGTLCSDAFPEIGKPNQPLIDFLIKWQQEGNKVILWTCREDTLLWIAVDWCAEHGLHFDAVNENLPERISYYKNDPRKIGADYYIDDLNATAVLGFDDECDFLKAKTYMCPPWLTAEIWREDHRMECVPIDEQD